MFIPITAFFLVGYEPLSNPIESALPEDAVSGSIPGYFENVK
jgi:hypothetical protein